MNEDQHPEGYLDRLGTFATSLCAIHCILTVLVPTLFGTLGLGMLMGHTAEWIFTAVALVFGLGALFFAWKKGRPARVMVLLSLGMLGLLASRGVESLGGDHDHGHGHGTHAEHGEGHGAHAEHSEGHDEHGEGHDEHGEGHDEHGEGHGKHGEGHDEHGEGHDEHGEGHGKHGEGHDKHGEHDEAHSESPVFHYAGTFIGVLGGLLLVAGHVFNLRAQKEDDCCSPQEQDPSRGSV